MRMKIIQTVAVILLCILSLSSCIGVSPIQRMIDGWEPTPCLDVAFVDDNYVVYNGERIDIDGVLEDALSTNGYFSNIPLVVIEGVLYGVYSYSQDEDDSTQTVYICSLDLGGGGVEVLYSYSYTFRFDEGDAESPDIESLYGPNAFYFDGVIYINDGVECMAYNIAEASVAQCTWRDIKAAEKEKTYNVRRKMDERGYFDYKSIIVKGRGVEQIVTVEYLAEKNEHIRELTEIGWSLGVVDRLEYFFDRFYESGDKVNLVCRVKELHYLLFYYDPKSGEVDYLYQLDSNFTFKGVIPVE